MGSQDNQENNRSAGTAGAAENNAGAAGNAGDKAGSAGVNAAGSAGGKAGSTSTNAAGSAGTNAAGNAGANAAGSTGSGKPKGFSLFREKSLEAVQSPESLNDYLKVTSPGVWLVLGAVILLLTGTILWGIFGRIKTQVQVAVVSDSEACMCIVPYASLQKVMGRGIITIDGKDYALKTDADLETMIITDQTNPYIRVLGGLSIGDVTVEVPLNIPEGAALADGIYTGTVVTESLQPISLLLQ